MSDVYGVTSLHDERLTVNTFLIRPIPADHLDRVRSRGIDDFGNPVVAIAANQGDPLRCCLRDAEAGEGVALIAYQPSSVGGPYAEVGPIFIHAESCPGWRGTAYPDGFRHRQQLLRAYDDLGNQLANIVVEPGAAEEGITALLEDPRVSFLHSRNLLAGCWMFGIVREPAA